MNHCYFFFFYLNIKRGWGDGFVRKELSGWARGPELDPQYHEAVLCLEISAPGGRQMSAWCSLDSWPNWICELQVEWEDPAPNNKMGRVWGRHQCQPLACTHMLGHPHTGAHPCTHNIEMGRRVTLNSVSVQQPWSSATLTKAYREEKTAPFVSRRCNCKTNFAFMLNNYLQKCIMSRLW